MNRSNSNIWPLDLGILFLGILVMLAILRVLRFDDPRILYNAWTYCLAVPTAMISSAMLAHAMLPNSAERSIQAGFLLSVLVHLGLTFAAINTVLFSGLWKDGSEQIEMRLATMSEGTSFESSSASSNPSVPDFLRPVQSQIDPASQVDLRPSTPTQQALELIDTHPENSIESSKDIQDKDLAKQPIQQPQLSQQQTQSIQRPDLMNAPVPRSPIETQAVEQTPLAQDELPVANPISIDRTTREPLPRLERSTQTPAPEALSGSVQQSIQERNLESTVSAASRFRIEQELTRPMQNATDPPESIPVPQPSMDRISRLPRPTSKSPIEAMDTPATSSQSNSNPSPASELAKPTDSTDPISQLLGSRSELTRRNTTAPASLEAPSKSSELGKIDLGTIQVGDVASVKKTTASSMRGTPELPSLGQPDALSLSLDKFRPTSIPNHLASKELVPVPAPAFEQRSRRIEEISNEELKAMGPLGPKTEESIERGLAFLAKHQRSDGSWKLDDYGQKTLIHSDAAATALALLSFQGAGYSHVQFKYQKECRKALDFLIQGQQPNGDLYRPTDETSDRNGWLYSHAIAALALCEAYGMTQDENLRIHAQRAVDFLVYSQDRQEGGWRYVPRVGSDTSVTGWGMMALKSAELSGLYVPKQTYEGIQKWLEHSQSSARERFLYRYNWLANTPETKHGTVPTPVMTSVGLLMRLYTGWKPTDSATIQGADWLLKRPPSLGTQQAPLRDTYYWYYATQVLFHTGGERWKAWYQSLYPLLIETQVTQGPYAGSWEPLGPIPDAWGEYAGRLYVTTMNLLSLEVTYRHLPIYEATSR